MSSPSRIRIRSALRRTGFDLVQKRPTLADLLRQRRVDVVLDVGANEGQFVSDLRSWGYRGRVVSFEPVPAVAASLRATAASDPRWEVVECALGREAGTATIHVSELSVFSSLRRPLPAARAYDARAATVASVEVSVRRLDEVVGEHVRPSERVFLKVDTQGNEPDVLDGAGAALRDFVGVQLEVGVVELYEGEQLAPGLIGRMTDEGFRIGQLAPVAYDPEDGFASLLQFDAVFVRPPDG